MIEPNILAFQNAELLAALDETPEAGWTRTSLATVIDRDPSNTMRALKALCDAGLVNDPPLTAGLTDEGRAQLAAFKRAQHGGERKRSRGQWPLDKFRPNPLNRPVRREVLADMAASMRGPAGLVQRIRATEPDANGVRMIVDGEHRWEAAKLLLDQLVQDPFGAIPDWLADGMPFEEADADPATALVITLVANARRADMSPWDDARQLLKLQQATDWTASELARRIGRVSEGERSGLRDVQQKLKIAREATPEAVADYERTGSWDTLRASVQTPKAATLGEQVAQAGAAVLARPLDNAELDRRSEPLCTYVAGEVYRARFDRRAPERSVGEVAPDLLAPGDFMKIEDAAEGGLIETLALPWSRPGKYYPHTFPQAQIQIAKLRGVDAWVSSGGYSLSDIGSQNRLSGVSRATPAHPDHRTALMAAIDDIAEGITRNKKGKIPAAIADWLENPRPAGPHVVAHVDYLNATRANEARRALGLLPPIPPANYGGAARDTGRDTDAADAPAAGVPTDSASAIIVGAPPTPTPAAPAIPLGQHLQNLADEDKERKRQGLRATLEVLLDRLEPVLTLLNGDRTDGVLPIDSDEADYFQEQLAEASRWAEDALAATGVFDPLPGEEIARKDIGSPAVPIRQSITPDHIVCLFDGRKFKSLKRHLRTRYDMSPDEYRAKWGLPADYPMVAPNYAKAREDLARQMGVRLASKRAGQ